MKTLFMIFTLSLLAATAYSQTNVTSYDWKVHHGRIDALFYEYAPRVIKAEREKLEAMLPKEVVDQYMKHFEDGLKSNTGTRMIEGGSNRWLEIAYQAGYAEKRLFRRGYFEGLTRKAEKE